MKKISFILIALLTCIVSMQAQQAKYVFYFIGDGMGVNHVHGTEMYQSELKGEIGISPLLFTQFPYATMVTTFSATNGVTDSAAAGTALATGSKTKNGALGVQKDLTTEVSSVATWAKANGYRVGVSSSVSIDHATPAAFYAHQGSRSSYYNIGLDLIEANFDFYAASDFLDPNNTRAKDGKTYESLYTLTQKAGFTLARGYKDYQKKAKKAEKMILFQSEAASAKDNSSIPYAIDRKKGDLSLADITRAGINFLSKNNNQGFFLMVEGGKIDWAAHSNDGATVMTEVQDLDEAVKVAYEFYEQHPDETLIVVTADHETGGLMLGAGRYEMKPELLKAQKMSTDMLSRLFGETFKKENNPTWEEAKAFFTEHLGLWGDVAVDRRTEQELKAIFDRNYGKTESTEERVVNMYSSSSLMVQQAVEYLNKAAGYGWSYGSHSGSPVGLYVKGKAAEAFLPARDNTDIAPIIAKVAGYSN